MTEYVLGFLFSSDSQYVALIKKNRPQWQAGNYNGIGGKVEPDESIQDAMKREFWEEAGLIVTDWNSFGVLNGKDYVVHLFRSWCDGTGSLYSKTDEEVSVCLTGSLPTNCVSNLRFLVPMALRTDYKFAAIRYY